LRRAICWLDRRAVDQTKRILERYPPERLFEITGIRLMPGAVLSKLLWLRENEPEHFTQAFKFLMAHDYVAFLLSGRTVTEHSMAGGTLLYDVRHSEWSAELLAFLGLTVDKLPSIQAAGTPLGRITTEAARETNLDEETMVVVGGQDQKCAAFGAGLREGMATVSLGTATGVSCLSESLIIDPEMRLPVFRFVIPHKWVYEGVLSTGGGSLRWLKDTFFPDKIYRELDNLGSQSPPGANGLSFYPHLAGAYTPRYSPSARGAFYGISLFTDACDVVRSVLEGVGFQMKQILEVQEDLTGPINSLTLFGGGATSPFWCAMIADITGKVVTRARTVETAALGASMLAGMGCGVFHGWQNASEVMVRSGDQWIPDPSRNHYYNSLYEQYVRQEEAQMKCLAEF
jgi:xylulokinase